MTIRFSLVAIFVATLLTFAPCSAFAFQGVSTNAVPIGPQSDVDELPFCPRFYVDPVGGDDFSNTGGSPTNAFQTIGNAMSVASANPLRSVVILLPGIYSASTNGESYPINLRDGVSIQGTSALNTIVNGEGGSSAFVFVPTSITDDFSRTYYDGFTVKNANSGFSLPDERVGLKPTLSNICLVRNQIGIRMTAVDGEFDQFPDDLDGNFYIEHRPRFVNLTFSENEIAIRDEIVPIINPGDYGEADPAIANCLFVANGLDFDGTDLDDLVTDAGTRSNVYCSFSPRIKPGRMDPSGGSLPFDCDSASDVFINIETCDYRLNPDLGSAAEMFLVDTGMTEGTDPLLYHDSRTNIRPRGLCGENIWDVDMEGFCNDRVNQKIIDIGADEMGSLIVAGYIPQTTEFNLNDTAQYWMRPTTGNPGVPFSSLRAWNERNNPGFLRWLSVATPGARPRGTVAPSFRAGVGVVCIADNGVMSETLGPFLYGVSNNVTITTASAASSRVNNQSLPFVGGAGQTLTNLQSYSIR